MAVVWAKQNGNWTDTTLWAFWNESTQQIEDYGQIPQVGDYVYCNGYQITFTYVVINLGNGTISNDINLFTNRDGGNLYSTSDISITANLMCGNVTIIKYRYDGRAININGDIYLCKTANTPTISYSESTNNNGTALTILGNVYAAGRQGYLIKYFYQNYSISIVGNVEIGVGGLFYNNNGGQHNLSVNGLIDAVESRLISKNALSTLSINGTLRTNQFTIQGNNLNLNGRIEYSGNNTHAGIYFANFSILNPDTFTWKDISEPRSNTFIIVTDADMNNHQQYPPEDEVKEGTEYVWGEKVGTYTPDYPPESVVLKDYEYGDSDARKTGTMVQDVNVEVGCVTPEDVRKDVPLVGMGVVGTLVVPSVDDVREGVVFDNGSVGTLIVQGGGDRLRIADFGYYTNAQSDTYIVDLTEQDKPKFAVAEERVLIEMFPDLDLDNIPDKYFDDLFVKYLKYRLIVEYYRTAGINSTFTPSEPTTEIVNYQNVRNEVWLNSANIYLKAWAKKYPESIVKPQRILL